MSAAKPDTDQNPEQTSSPTEDLALVRGFLRRDPLATERFLLRLEAVPRAVACMNRRSGGRLGADEVADVAQDVTAIVLRKLDTFPPGAPLDAWFYRIGSLELSNAMRRKRRQATSVLPAEVAARGENAIETFERREFVLRAFEQIRPEAAEAVRLHHLDGLTFVEIAEQLQQTVNTIKGRYYRGIEQLGGILEPY